MFVGMIIGLTYYLTHLNFLSKIKAMVHVKDTLFVVLTLFICVFSLLHFNYGEFRIFILGAVVLGVLLFNVTFKLLFDKLK